jgi:hypothetical protein
MEIRHVDAHDLAVINRFMHGMQKTLQKLESARISLWL